jgi:hypothetical protein
MCQVCCDHLVFIYRNAGSSTFGHGLKLDTQQGQEAIRDVIDKTTVEKCKRECQSTYPMSMPQPESAVPRDSNLGTEKCPAVSCADIKKWGP